MIPPTLETPRLSLRAHALADFDACAAMWADPAVVRYIGNRPSTREEAWARLLRYRGHWALLDFGFWAIVERATGAFVGEVGFAEFRRAIEPPLGVEAGWVLARDAHGKGFATEALGAALAWATAHVPVRVIDAVVDVGNAASLRVANKCGFVEVRRATYHGEELVILRAPLSAPAQSPAQT
jgi:RimJ/RimL family protein N-acetyltransferase